MGEKGSVSPESWLKFHDSPFLWEKAEKSLCTVNDSLRSSSGFEFC